MVKMIKEEGKGLGRESCSKWRKEEGKGGPCKNVWTEHCTHRQA